MQPAYYWLVMTHERVVIIVRNKEGFLGHWSVIIPTCILVVEHFEEDCLQFPKKKCGYSLITKILAMEYITSLVMWEEPMALKLRC